MKVAGINGAGIVGFADGQVQRAVPIKIGLSPAQVKVFCRANRATSTHGGHVVSDAGIFAENTGRNDRKGHEEKNQKI